MSTIFPRVGKKSLGYNVTQVEAFLAAARRAYDQPDHPDARHDEIDGDTGAVESVDGIAAGDEIDAETLGAPPRAADGTEAIHASVAHKDEGEATRTGLTLTAEGIRHTAFSMHKDGYSPELVDAALERLEDAFAARERDQATRAGGEQAWMIEAEGTAAVLVARLSRAPGHRFTRTSVLAVGYRRVDVDRLANKLVRYFQDGRELTVDDVRTAVFRPERGGYREAQVDLVLDSVVDVMLAVR
ncbi:MAG: DivIVA domain-containing protein [Cryobacterium sp.]|uniref:DivIVA domain-containing protein n=1 Tax=unclassified Cryobacterium TaxID=2649013 RepID=UPI001A29172E|nr:MULTISPECIES: DivIVA domain-containing protein [unclassified Cryobacterium]MCY7405398.1 DivIVA domain-containing protein [Cryobacterium sp.]MEC5152902.1 DivIVA domain-containing protein [Cryobacterium sp. CAN_C3]